MSGDRPLLNIIDPVVLQDRPIPDRQWLVPGWIPMGAVTLLYGDGGTGKSLLAMQLQTSTALGRQWLGLPVRHVRSLGFYSEDDADELHRRQEQINTHVGACFGDLEDMRWVAQVGLDALLMTFDGNEGIETQVYTTLLAEAKAFGAQLLVIDTAADTFGGEEIKRQHVTRFMLMLGALAREIDGAVVLLAHPSRAGMNSGAGDGASTAWSNKARSRLYLDHWKEGEGEVKDPDRRVLSRKKANYSARQDQMDLHWREGVFTVSAASTGIVASIERRVAERVFIDLLDEFMAQGRNVSPSRNASNYAPKAFSISSRRDGYTKADFAGAMERLFSRGDIKVEKYSRNRNMADRIVRTAPKPEGAL